jgi:hypothetical protein
MMSIFGRRFVQFTSDVREFEFCLLIEKCEVVKWMKCEVIVRTGLLCGEVNALRHTIDHHQVGASDSVNDSTASVTLVLLSAAVSSASAGVGLCDSSATGLATSSNTGINASSIRHLRRKREKWTILDDRLRRSPTSVKTVKLG